MTLPGLARQTVFRLRGTVITDEWGASQIDWSEGATDRLKIMRCSFQPLPGDEYNQGRDTVITRWEWFGPPNADVRSDDHIEYKGLAYEVDGSVQEPEGLGLDHKRAVCKRAS